MQPIIIKNGSRYEENGWIRIDVSGTSKEMGYAHGSLLYKEIDAVMKSLEYIVLEDTGIPLKIMADILIQLYGTRIEERYPNLMQEIKFRMW